MNLSSHLNKIFPTTNPTKILHNLMEQPCNNYCVDCSEPLAANVDCTHYTFVCVACSAIHREIGDKIKSVGVSTFTDEEIERLKQTSNDDFNNIWMSCFKRGDQPLLPASNEETRRAFINAKYRQKRWHKDSPKISTQSRRSMFPTDDADSDDDFRSRRQNQNSKFTVNNHNNNNNIDEYSDDDDNYSQKPPNRKNLPRGDPFASANNNNNNYQQQNFNYQNSFQQPQNNFGHQQQNYQSNPQQDYQNNQQQNYQNSYAGKSTELASSSKNAPFKKHKSSEKSAKSTQQQFQPQFQAPAQNQQQSQQNQNDLLIDFMAPTQNSNNMQSAIDDIFGPSSSQTQQQPQQFQQYQQQQQPSFPHKKGAQQNPPQSQNSFDNILDFSSPQQQQQKQFQQHQPQPQQQQFQQYQQQPTSFPHKKGSPQNPPQSQNSFDNILGFSSPPQQHQYQQQPQQDIDDLLNFGQPNSQPPPQLNDDELLDLSNPQLAAQQQQISERRKQLREAMVNLGDEDIYANPQNNNSVAKLRSEGLGVQDSPTFMAKVLIASGYCSQPPNQRAPMPGQHYGNYQQNPNQYYRPQ